MLKLTMAIIDPELPKEYWGKDKINRPEARLAKFPLNRSDILRFYELGASGKRTGRYYDRQAKDFHKIHKKLN